MPSIPQSLLWISLVVLWLFVLVPMLISKRDAVRRTSDVALATRVLNSGSSARLLRRKGPAAGHHSDPDWEPVAADDDGDEDDFDNDTDTAPRRSVVLAAAQPAPAEPDYLDVDVVEEDSGALPVGASAEFVSGATEPGHVDVDVEAVADDDVADEADDETAAEYEYVADSSGLEGAPESDGETADNEMADSEMADAVGAARRRRYESKTAAAVSARKFKFRTRMVTGLAVALLATGVAAYLVAPWAWWLCGAVGVVTLLYLGYLRRQTRIEEQVRRRRAQRVKRSRLGVENTGDTEFDVVPARLRRPGAAVLEIDDEDPAFEHLDEVAFARHFDLPRAAGQ
jgi:hypothetical protein